MNQPPESSTMSCLEVRGGNTRVETFHAAFGLDVWVLSHPYLGKGCGNDSSDADEGGDVHFVTTCATGRITRLMLADVSGHGPEVGATARDLKRLLSSHSNYTEQTRLVSAVNNQFVTAAAEHDTTRAVFATALVSTYFAPTFELRLSSAGHPPPIRFDAEQGEWAPILIEDDAHTTGMYDLPLGVLDSVSYRAATLTLGERDLVVMYTDAIIEAADPKGQMLGVDGLVGLLGMVDPENPDGLIAALMDRVDRYRRGVDEPHSDPEPYDDDLSVVVVRRNSLAKQGSVAGGLASGAKLLGQAARSVVNKDAPLVLPERSWRAIAGAFVERFNR